MKLLICTLAKSSFSIQMYYLNSHTCLLGVLNLNEPWFVSFGLQRSGFNRLRQCWIRRFIRFRRDTVTSYWCLSASVRLLLAIFDFVASTKTSRGSSWGTDNEIFDLEFDCLDHFVEYIWKKLKSEVVESRKWNQLKKLWWWCPNVEKYF